MIKDIYYTGKYKNDGSYDDSWREPYWEALRKEAGADEAADKIVDSLKLLYTLYTDDLIKWYANLYDPGTGAFYCTASGKANEGFLPDVESTVQAFVFMNTSGLLEAHGNDYRNILTDEMKKKLIRFVKGMQRPNGYFYNYLMSEDAINEAVPKRGRDLGWCTMLLRDLGDCPTYDTPNGVKGNGLDKDGKPVADASVGGQPSAECKSEDGCSAANSKNEGNCSAANSKSAGCCEDKKSAAALNYPEYLENKETMLEYLNSNVKVVEETYPAGNHLNATYSQYMARDVAMGWLGTEKSLTRGLIEWLNERIDPETGYWSHDKTFNGTNGYFKIIVIYNKWGYPYPEALKATEAILAGLLGDQPTTHNSCEIYNLWSALISTKENVLKCYSEQEGRAVLSKIADTMKEKGADAIINTYKKQSGYQTADGAFCHQVDRIPEPDKIKFHQGKIPVGLFIPEGDVDAIDKVSTGITRNILRAYGFKTNVPIFSDKDFKLFRSIMEGALPVEKKNTKTYR